MSGDASPIPGTSDIWEPEISEWRVLERAAEHVFPLYGCEELRTPIIERTELFVRGIGEETEVVQKEMYTFEDRGGRSVTLRPEGTAGVIRAISARGLAPGEERRVFYLGPMFRGERPAAGRRRQFHQIGVENVGRCSPLADAEAILMLLHYLEQVGIPDGRLLLNTRGAAEDRRTAAVAYREYFAHRLDAMCEDCRRRIDVNVWRILDCKNPQCIEVVADAPRMTDLIGEESRKFFETVLDALRSCGVRFTVAPRLVRGLDYYEHTVFEVVHDALGAQNAVAGGGRYRLFLPGQRHPIEGVGFAVGMERLLMIRRARGIEPHTPPPYDVWIVCIGDRAVRIGFRLAADLRRAGLRTHTELEPGRSPKAQLRAANRSGSPLALIIGDDELDRNVIQCKDMRSSAQKEIPMEGAADRLKELLNTPGDE